MSSKLSGIRWAPLLYGDVLVCVCVSPYISTKILIQLAKSGHFAGNHNLKILLEVIGQTLGVGLGQSYGWWWIGPHTD